MFQTVIRACQVGFELFNYHSGSTVILVSIFLGTYREVQVENTREQRGLFPEKDFSDFRHKELISTSDEGFSFRTSISIGSSSFQPDRASKNPSPVPRKSIISWAN